MPTNLARESVETAMYHFGAAVQPLRTVARSKRIEEGRHGVRVLNTLKESLLVKPQENEVCKGRCCVPFFERRNNYILPV